MTEINIIRHPTQNDLDIVYSQLNSLMQEIYYTQKPAPQRLDYCQAWVYTVEHDGKLYHVLKSYDTIVAFECCGVVYDVLRIEYGYTPTSNKQILKFARRYGARIDRYMGDAKRPEEQDW